MTASVSTSGPAGAANPGLVRRTLSEEALLRAAGLFHLQAEIANNSSAFIAGRLLDIF